MTISLEMRRQLIDMAAESVLGLAPKEQLVAVAHQVLESGFYSDELLDLADSMDRSAEEARGRVLAVLAAAGLREPTKSEAAQILSRSICRTIVDGRIEPYVGARRMWTVAVAANDGSHLLDPFIYAASEWEDRIDDRDLFADAIRQQAVLLLTQLVDPYEGLDERS